MRRLLLLAAVVVSSCVAGCGVNDPYQGRTSTTPTPTTASTTSTAPVGPTSTTADADEANPALSPTDRKARSASERAARAFLRTYLPYSYGQQPGTTIRAATPALRRDLVQQPPRVSPALSERAAPTVRSLRASGITRQRVYFLAQVDDGQSAVYGTTLTVVHRGGRWLVSEVQ